MFLKNAQIDIEFYFILRFDPIHSAMQYTHQDLRYDVVHYVPEMIRLGLLTEDVFQSAYGSIDAWQNSMIQEGTYTDQIFIQTAVELLGRQVIMLLTFITL